MNWQVNNFEKKYSSNEEVSLETIERMKGDLGELGAMTVVSDSLLEIQRRHQPANESPLESGRKIIENPPLMQLIRQRPSTEWVSEMTTNYVYSKNMDTVP